MTTERTDTRARTIWQAISETLNGPAEHLEDELDRIDNAYVIEDICRALGVDPNAPVANLHVLSEDQKVIRPQTPWDSACAEFIEEREDDIVPWVVVRSAVTADDTDSSTDTPGGQ